MIVSLSVGQKPIVRINRGMTAVQDRLMEKVLLGIGKIMENY